MTNNCFHAALITMVVLAVSAGPAVAQSEIQQGMSSRTGTTASTSRVNAAAEGSSGGLKMVPEDFAKLRLAPGFLVKVDVLDDADFAGSYRIDQQGDIALPILGTMHVAGENASEARLQIQRRLFEAKILKDPQVDLLVLEYSAPEVTIIGEVTNPGKYSLLVPRKLVDVLALAGGTTVTAGNEVQITHGGADAEPVLIHYSRATNPKTIEDAVVQPGDTVQVKRAGIVYVLGAVTRPGGYVMQEDGTLRVLQAISLANGTAVVASTSTIYLLRRNGDGTVVYFELPYRKMLQGRVADMQLHGTDVLYVPTNKIKSILTYSQGILTSAASASVYAAATH